MEKKIIWRYGIKTQAYELKPKTVLKIWANGLWIISEKRSEPKEN